CSSWNEPTLFCTRIACVGFVKSNDAGRICETATCQPGPTGRCSRTAPRRRWQDDPHMTIDVWVQLMPPGYTKAAGILTKYGRTDIVEKGATPETLLPDMDRFGIDKAIITFSDNEVVLKAVKDHPDRLIGQVHADPTNIMDMVREIERYRDEGFVSMRIEPFLWRKA